MTTTSIGFIFPGQGSQSVGMLADIAKDNSSVQATFSAASKVLNYDLWELTQVGPVEVLNQTTRTQPALLVASFALYKLIEKKLTPTILAGHSLGEYTALVCAGSLDFLDAVKLVAARGEFMQTAVPAGVGALAAIVGLSDEVVESICKEVRKDNEVLEPANYNSVGQVVIAGDIAAVQRALILAKEKGAKIAKELPVSVPSHCSLMKPAAEKLATYLKNISIHSPRIPVISNVDVKFYQTPDEIRDGLVRQLFSPVRWVETMQLFGEKNVTQIIECGPGKVLTGLGKRILPNIEISSGEKYVV